MTQPETTPGPTWTVAGRLFQARMWREYAMAWDGRELRRSHNVRLGRAWVENILGVSREECLRRSRENALAARQINQVSDR